MDPNNGQPVLPPQAPPQQPQALVLPPQALAALAALVAKPAPPPGWMAAHPIATVSLAVSAGVVIGIGGTLLVQSLLE